LIFFCLENKEIAKHRVEVRVAFDEHFVDDETINFKWREGYKNLNTYYPFFDKILIVDNSADNEVYKNLVQIEKGKSILMTDQLPPYFSKRLPEIFKLINIA
jgi:predicted ABC-type ATPase